MEVKAGYKQTAAGLIPEDWDVKPYGEDLRLLSGQHVRASYANSDGDGIPYLTGPSDFSGHVVHQTKYTNRPTTICRSGDILITVKGSGTGTLAIADTDYCISRQLIAIRACNWDIRFIFYQLLWDTHYYESCATGLIPGISRSNILERKISLPPLREQRAIAAALSDVDALITALGRLIAKKRDIKQAAMQELLTGKRRLLGVDSRKSYKQTDVGIIPEDWGEDCIRNLASITTGAKNTEDKIEDGEFPLFVRSSTVERINCYSFDGEAVLTAGDGVGTGKIFHYINGKFDFHQRVYMINNFSKALMGYFFYLYFSNHFYSRIMSMTAKSSVDSVRMEMIADMMIPLPPIHEQTAIATILTDMDAELTALEQKRNKTKAIKQGMMQELLTGRIRLV